MLRRRCSFSHLEVAQPQLGAGLHRHCPLPPTCRAMRLMSALQGARIHLPPSGQSSRTPPSADRAGLHLLCLVCSRMLTDVIALPSVPRPQGSGVLGDGRARGETGVVGS